MPSKNAKVEDLLTPAQAAEKRGVSVELVYLCIREGTIPVERRDPILLHPKVISEIPKRPRGRPKAAEE